MKITKISSGQNQYVKKWKKLHTRKGRMEQGSFLIEGEHLVGEAYSSGLQFRAVLIREGESTQKTALYEAPLYELSASLFSQVTQIESPQGIAAIVKMPLCSTENLVTKDIEQCTFILLDAVQDPGNLGTLIRTAEAAKVSGMIFGKGTVDPYNPKVIRSAMGSLFRMPFLQKDLADMIPILKTNGVTILGTSPRADAFVFDYVFSPKTAILLGNEGCGVQPDLMKLADAKVNVPMPGQTESLNVSVTGSILLYEQLRQRLCT